MDKYHTDNDTKEFSRYMNKEERKKEKEELHEELIAGKTEIHQGAVGCAECPLSGNWFRVCGTAG